MCSRMFEKSLLLGVTLCLLIANTSEAQLFRRGIFRGPVQRAPQAQRQPQRTPQPAKNPTTIQPNNSSGAESVQTPANAPKQISILQIIDENGNIIFPKQNVDPSKSETNNNAPNQQTKEASEGDTKDNANLPAADEQVRIRYPVAAPDELKYVINGVTGSLKPGSNLTIPAGQDFEFSFLANPGAKYTPFPTEKPGEFIFESSDFGWRVAKFPSTNQNSVKK